MFKKKFNVFFILYVKNLFNVFVLFNVVFFLLVKT